jgi:hypothetical protein
VELDIREEEEEEEEEEVESIVELDKSVVLDDDDEAVELLQARESEMVTTATRTLTRTLPLVGECERAGRRCQGSSLLPA